MRTQTPKLGHKTLLFLLCFIGFLTPHDVVAVQILSKSKLEKCEKTSDSGNLNCTKKIVLNMAVPSGASGGEASIVAEIVEVEENSSQKMQNFRIPPVLTVNKSAAYALYQLTYIRDVAFKPEEYYVKTRKCERDADAKVVKICERLRDENDHIIEHTEPICCPCGPQRRVPSSCGNVFDKLMKGKANTAHCVRFPGDWFHVFGIGQRSVGFSVLIQVKTGSKVSEVFVGPENRTAISNDNFLRVNLIGDFVGYTNIPSFEDFYLVIPRQGGPGQPQNLGRNLSMWMLLERVRFSLDGVECNKIGVSYEAFNGQPNFCSSPFWSCLHNQLWNFWEADQNRIERNQLPLYGVEGRFERINQHPNAGTHSFSIGVTEVINTNLLIELSADDVEYVYQRSPGKIVSINVPTFEALTQFGTATITATNTGEVEASYSLTFDCSSDVTLMEEQFLIMKPKETTTQAFKLYPATDQAAKYVCAAILKDSDYKEVDRAECQFSTTSTVLDNGSQGNPFNPPKTGATGFFDSVESIWNNLWNILVDFVTGKTCRRKCPRFFDFRCHIQYICMSWVVMFGLLLAIFPTVVVLLWLLHQKGLFDPLYDWWEDHFWDNNQHTKDIRKHRSDVEHSHAHVHKHHGHDARNHKHGSHHKRRNIHNDHRHNQFERGSDYYYHLHHVHKDKPKHGRRKHSSIMQKVDENTGYHGHKKERRLTKDYS
ncbi:protein HAPLESS 2 [Prunus avium]|uniref:Protein HAPLESS 2 n=1 Tax=Prunus avium TaxID=42229 RepID=A0A6P5RYI8_PRUAV|nr:protein HAPLESS 2 [Prunus avium]